MIADQEIIEEIAKRGDEAVAKLESQCFDVASQISKIQKNLADLRQSRHDRAQKLLQAKQDVATLKATQNQAVQYATLAQGTFREQETIKAASSAKKDLQTARKALDKREQESADIEKQSQVSEAELSSSLQSLQDEQERLEAEKDGMRSAREQATIELGRQKHAAYLQAYLDKNIQEMSLKEQLLSAQVEKNDLLATALKDLAPWPNLQAKMQTLKPREDAILRAIEASLHYADAYLQSIQSFPQPWHLSLPSLRRGFHLLDAIMVPQEEIIRGRQNVRELAYRRDLIRELRDEYRAYLAAKQK